MSLENQKAELLPFDETEYDRYTYSIIPFAYNGDWNFTVVIEKRLNGALVADRRVQLSSEQAKLAIEGQQPGGLRIPKEIDNEVLESLGRELRMHCVASPHLADAADAWRDLEHSRGEISRLRSYRRLTYSMKADMHKHSMIVDMSTKILDRFFSEFRAARN
jgi:hypothetical protein